MSDAESVIKGILDDVSKVMGQASVAVPNYLRPNTPIRTGHLRRSWRGRHTATSAKIRNTAFYADFIESGTVKMRARPMLGPAIPIIMAELERALTTGTDFTLTGGAYPDVADQLKRGYQSKYGNYGSHVGYSG